MNGNHKSGITTGTAATAAALASILHIKGQPNPKSVTVEAPFETLEVEIESVESIEKNSARATVIKKPYSDPDVTVGLEIVATVEINRSGGVDIRGGDGVGIVTKPGLQVPPGEYAINPVPRRMIKKNLEKLLEDGEGAVVTITVPKGREAARKTMNARLGIKGGISILGTTGVARPMSSEAYRESLSCQLDIAIGMGYKTLVFVPGNIGERLAISYFKDIERDRIIHMGNFPGYMLDAACSKGAERIIIFGHAGKLVKLAAGIFNTKNSVADARNEIISAHAGLKGAEKDIIKSIFMSKTTEEMIHHLDEAGLTEQVFNSIADAIIKRCQMRCSVPMEVMILQMDGRILNSNFRVDRSFKFNH